jgi:hypothetical protein
MAAPKCISFEEIVEQGREANVRVTVDSLIFAVDLAMVGTGKSRDDAGKTLRGLSEETFRSGKYTYRSFPGKGNARTRLLTFQHAIELIMVLPGKIAKKTRVKFAEIIKRCVAGDKSLVPEIRANAESASLISQLARASLDAEAVYKVSHKRKLELDERMAAIEMKRAETEAKHAAILAMRAATLAMQSKLYTSLCPNKVMDERGRLLLKDCVPAL